MKVNGINFEETSEPVEDFKTVVSYLLTSQSRDMGLAKSVLKHFENRLMSEGFSEGQAKATLKEATIEVNKSLGYEVS